MIMEFKEMSNQEKQWKAISLFAGAGGCSLGFKMQELIFLQHLKMRNQQS